MHSAKPDKRRMSKEGGRQKQDFYSKNFVTKNRVGTKIFSTITCSYLLLIFGGVQLLLFF